MKYGRKVFSTLLLFGVLFGAVIAVGPAQAYEGVSVKHARQHVRTAQRDVARAQARLREARTVLDATRHYSAYDYSSFAGRYVDPVLVGRWVWLANDVGWPQSQWTTLFCVIARESSGNAGQMNTTGSGAAGLLQLMPGWYAGTYYGSMPDFNPRNPRLNLKYGLWGWRVDGWRPWSVN